jgi:hypothetical protein
MSTTRAPLTLHPDRLLPVVTAQPQKVFKL